MKAIRNGTATLLTVLVTGALLQPQAAYAGDKEWATAGKILAGVTALHVFTKGFPIRSSQRHTTVIRKTVTRSHGRSRHGYKSLPIPKCTPRRRPSYHHRGRYEMNSRVYKHPHTSTHRYEVYSSVPDLTDGEYTLHFTHESVYMDISKYERIYQPRIRGAVAYLQKRHHGSSSWTTKSTHPSIW